MSLAIRIDGWMAAVESALADGDWTAIADLDVQCRRLLSDLAAGLASKDESALQRLPGLVGTYRSLVARSREERDAVRNQLSQFQRGKTAARAYQQLL